jgi:hypothetical protein
MLIDNVISFPTMDTARESTNHYKHATNHNNSSFKIGNKNHLHKHRHHSNEDIQNKSNDNNIIKSDEMMKFPAHFKDIYPELNLKSNISLSWKECMRLYGERNYLDDSQKRLPPMLYTFPGSGNTWTRLVTHTYIIYNYIYIIYIMYYKYI